MIYGGSRLGTHGVRLRERIERDLMANLAILPFVAGAAGQCGLLRAALESQGTPLAEADLRIASIALAHNLTLGTGNERHFRRIPGLVIENWLS